MRPITASIALFVFTAFSVFGWVVEKPINYAKQLKEAHFVGLVEVQGIKESGKSKAFEEGGIKFREQILELKVLSGFKGEATVISCSIYREPTRDELISDGVPEGQAMKVLLNLGVNEALHLFPARVGKGDHLLTYLDVIDGAYLPATGNLYSSRSFLRVELSNLVNRFDLTQAGEQVGAGNPLDAQ